MTYGIWCSESYKKTGLMRGLCSWSLLPTDEIKYMSGQMCYLGMFDSITITLASTILTEISAQNH